jgi:hypothetical protein
MRRSTVARLWITALALATNGVAAAADAPKVLHSFGLGAQLGGNNLYAGLILDAAGNLYGAAEAGGRYRMERVLMPRSPGTVPAICMARLLVEAAAQPVAEGAASYSS